MKCVGCGNKIKQGEFVVLCGGALEKYGKGATMGGKNLLGFLHICNHFDSTKSYQTFQIENKGSNGQFEFYACSHTCLAVFFLKQLKVLRKFMNMKKFEMAPVSKLEKIGHKWVEKTLGYLGHPEAFVTDESQVSDFLRSDTTKFLQQMSKKFGFPVRTSDFIWNLAKKLKEKA